MPESPLGKLLDCIRMQSVVCSDARLQSPWAVEMPAFHNSMMYHLVVEGELLLEVADQTFSVREGDFVLLPKGLGHKLSDGKTKMFTPFEDLPIEFVTERFEVLNMEGSGRKTRIFCGAVTFEHPLALKIIATLPKWVHISAKQQQVSGIVRTLSEFIMEETRNLDAGAVGIISRLADILIVSAIRQNIQSLDSSQTKWLTVLSDQGISQALSLLHERPERHWSLEELANTVGMSRTRFAEQFKALVGSTPMEYLTEWRMSLAYNRLSQTDQSVLAIALDLGYQSESAFSRAFKKVTGVRPGKVRQT